MLVYDARRQRAPKAQGQFVLARLCCDGYLWNLSLPWWAPVPNMFLRFVAEKAMGAKTPDEGAFSTMHLLFAELVGNGRYYGSDGKRSPLDTYRKPGSPPYEGP